jgi:DNA repair protein RadA/Sms
VQLADVEVRAQNRDSTGIEELDRVLGGGLVPGQVVLVGGEPGIGKSTLLLQALGMQSKAGYRTLYVTGEESREQVRLRADRLGAGVEGLYVLAENDMKSVLEAMDDLAPEVTVVDSIQMMVLAGLPGAPGSVSQVRECGMALVSRSKGRGGTVFLVGHVTKDGSLAGPRTLEHMVDTVLYFEGDRFQSLRLLRSVKNRFGPTLELGVFEMTGSGLEGVADPSRLFLGTLGTGSPGGAVVPCLEGHRPLLVEIQSLVASSPFGTPVRRATGTDPNRLPMILAVLEKRGGLGISGRDIFVNVAGGIRVTEPAADLGVALAVASSFLERPLPGGSIVAGEIGLRGEIRPVSRAGMRIAEGKKLGFTRAIFPSGSLRKGEHGGGRMEVEEVADMAEALRFLGG